ncbi:MAG: glutamine synthetase family protein [Alphaproteobacteria bacterium]|nr:glutamine synthetase family protein [Pseudomonadota bacterium]
MDEMTSNLSGALVEEVRRQIREHDLQTVIVGYSDLFGVLRGKHMPAAYFAKDPNQVIEFSEFIYSIDLAGEIITRPPDHTGWWPSWETGFADFYVHADLSTFRVAPWLDRTGVVLCEVLRDGRPFLVDPRHILRRVVERTASHGLKAVMAAELEFLLFRETRASLYEKGFRGLEAFSHKPVPYDIRQGDIDHDIIGRLREDLIGFGIPVISSHPETALGQYEVQMHHEPLPETADNAFLFKYAVKEIARLGGAVASFMARPVVDFGSSCHIHQSLWREDGKSAFYDPDAPLHLSKTARHFVGGQMATLRDFDCLFAPYENSFRRLTPDLASGTTATWGFDNRTVTLRIVGHDENTLRVEHRRGGADVNPYFAMAAALAGGLYGIENEIEPPEPFEGNAYTDPSIEQLPGSLSESVDGFERSAVAKDYLGEEFVQFYARTRRWEVEQARPIPTDWEVRRFLEDV